MVLCIFDAVNHFHLHFIFIKKLTVHEKRITPDRFYFGRYHALV